MHEPEPLIYATHAAQWQGYNRTDPEPERGWFGSVDRSFHVVRLAWCPFGSVCVVRTC